MVDQPDDHVGRELSVEALDEAVAYGESGVPSPYARLLIPRYHRQVHEGLMRRSPASVLSLTLLVLAMCTTAAGVLTIWNLPPWVGGAWAFLPLWMERFGFNLLYGMYRKNAAERQRLVFAFGVVQETLRSDLDPDEKVGEVRVVVQDWLPPHLCPCNGCMTAHRGRNPQDHPEYREQLEKTDEGE